jgi:ribosomal protein S14
MLPSRMVRALLYFNGRGIILFESKESSGQIRWKSKYTSKFQNKKKVNKFMANFIERDKKRRQLVCQYELKRIEYQSIIKNTELSKEIRYNFINKLNALSRNSSKVRVKNRCILTGRSKAVYRFCKINRIKMRELAAKGVLNGIKKSSW